MRVVANYDVCEANLVCMKNAPEVFYVNDDDELTILMPEIDDPEIQEKARRAVQLCPRAALSIEE